MRLRRLIVVVTLGVIVAGLGASQPLAVSPNIVLSQVYGGGGNTGATYTHDFIELAPKLPVPVALAYWSDQPASEVEVEPRLKSSMKSCVYVAPVLPPPP